MLLESFGAVHANGKYQEGVRTIGVAGERPCECRCRRASVIQTDQTAPGDDAATIKYSLCSKSAWIWLATAHGRVARFAVSQLCCFVFTAEKNMFVRRCDDGFERKGARLHPQNHVRCAPAPYAGGSASVSILACVMERRVISFSLWIYAYPPTLLPTQIKRGGTAALGLVSKYDQQPYCFDTTCDLGPTTGYVPTAHHHNRNRTRHAILWEDMREAQHW